MNEIAAAKTVNAFPPSKKIDAVSSTVAKLLAGADIEDGGDFFRIIFDDEDSNVHKEDFELAQTIAKEIAHVSELSFPVTSITDALEIKSIAAKKLAKRSEQDVGKNKVVMLKDKSGSGYWRMLIPARYMDRSKFSIDVSEIGVHFSDLMDYDTIFVQRVHTWDEFYTVERLKENGKKIVYDIDDDIFSIPESNPAFDIMGNDYQESAAAMMELVDAITTTSQVLKEKLGHKEKTFVIPNAIDLKDGWRSTGYVGSPDNKKRILWQGSATHGEDWKLCIEAIDEIMKENDEVLLLILGYLPPVVQNYLEDPSATWWDDKVQYMDFSEPETYARISKQIRADVALAPLESSEFNRSKSCIKFVEFTAMGIPTIASNVTPYKEVIRHGENGFMASTKDEWKEIIESCFASPALRSKIVSSARQTVIESFNINRVIKEWEKVLTI